MIDLDETRAEASIGIRVISHAGLIHVLPELAVLLRDVVNDTGGLGFLPPMGDDEALSYWLSIRPELRAASRILLGAYDGERMVGTAQLAFPSWPNARHRAAIHKMLVTREKRGRGIGTSLMSALEKVAKLRGRSLLILNTRHGSPAEKFYTALGFTKAGVIPGYAAGANGEWYADATYYKQLD
jgi:GNAT superfamily N-acetyltransferase